MLRRDEIPLPAPSFQRGRTLRLWLHVELLLLFFGVPTGLWAWREVDRHLPIIPILLAGGLLTLIYLLRSPTFPRRDLIRTRSLAGPGEWRRILLLWLLAAAGMSAFVLGCEPGAFLDLPRQRPGLWGLLMVVYPLLSVYPQEIIYRAFFLQRYGPVLRRRWAILGVSAAAFGYVHIVFGNWLAVILSGLGGLLFMWTYLRTRSLLYSTLEHGLYGQLVFTVGLVIYFREGTVAFISAW